MKPSVDGSRIPITDNVGALWTIESGWVYRNGTRAAMKATELQWIALGGQNVPGIYALASNNPKHWWLSSVATNGTVTWTDVGVTDPSTIVSPLPTITGFTVTPLSVTAGSPVVLNATVTNGVPMLDGAQITLPYTHTPTSSRLYQIVVVGAGGTVSSPVISVTVVAIVVPPGTSPDKTSVPPSASIIAADGGVWTLAGVYPTDPPNKYIMRNGVNIDRGVLLYYQSGIVWFQYSNKGVLEWWQWNGTATIAAPAGPPGFYMPPVFSYPDPYLSLPVGVPTSLKPYVSSMLPLVFTAFDTAQATLTGPGMFTQKIEGQIATPTEVDDGHV